MLKGECVDSEHWEKIASKLCQWSVFVENIDESNKELLTRVVPFADESHNSYSLMKNLARLSEKQPMDAHYRN